MQRNAVPLRTNDKGASWIRAPVGANGLRADSHLEAFGFQGERQPRRAGIVVLKDVGAGRARGGGRRGERRVRDGITSRTDVFRPIRIEIERQRQRPSREALETILLL